MTVKAPFNFVPVSDKVYFPEWAGYISHDIPFEDGVSGSIKVKITAKSPIFVRNGHTQAEAEDKSDAFKQFSNVDGKYYIPGTSVKGAIRSVLEIMSFGKMTTQETHKFACKWRDEDYPAPKNLCKEIKTGWLKKDEKGYYVEECKYARIGHVEIDNYLKEAYSERDLFRNAFSKRGNSEAFTKSVKDRKTQKEIGRKTSFYKYDSIKGKVIEGLSFSVVQTTYTKIDRLKVDKSGTLKGTIVFTGQPDMWKWPRPVKLDSSAGKFYEFVYLDNGNAGRRYDLSTDDYDEFVYLNQNNYQWSEVWKLQVGKKPIPVFFRIADDGTVKNLGLSYLYKIPGGVAPADCIPIEHKQGKKDLAECIFGYVSKEKNAPSLRGRVQFGHAWVCGESMTENRKYVLASPKASYYPIYVKNGKPWNVGAVPAGRKRYIVRDKDYNKSMGSDAMECEGCVLLKGAEFEETISFHNLKPVELGAILSALTFDGHDECLHSLGQGKPFGWGTAKITIEDVVTDTDDFDIDSCKKMFKEAVKSKLSIANWEGIAPIKTLFEMSKPIPADRNDAFWYMSLDDKEFADAKENKEYLRPFSEVMANPFARPISSKTLEPSNAPRVAKKQPMKMSSMLKGFKRSF